MPSPSAPELRPLLAFAHELADAARPLARAYFRSLTAIEHKSDRTPVTNADREIEAALRARIRSAFPDHGILGEEEGAERADAEWLWVLDPIDGTKSFAIGSPLFGTLIGLMHRGRPVLGVLEASGLGERWAAATGIGASHQGRTIRVRPRRPLAEAVLCCTTPHRLVDEPGWRALRQRVLWTSYGGDCCAYAFLAMGGADLLVDHELKTHDWCALAPIVIEAGGVMVDWDGGALHLRSGGSVVAATCRELAEEALAIVGGRRARA